jgi:hypothetical protein
MKDQIQEGGEGSSNFQAGRDLHVHEGITATQATEIALAVGRDNLMQFKDYAQNVVLERVEYLVDQYVAKVIAHPRAQLDAVKDPDIQYSLLTAEKEYARSGDRTKADLLVEMLVERSALEDRGLQALILNEAIATVARLTPRQVNTLTAGWLIRRVKYLAMENVGDFAGWLSRNLEPYLDISEHEAEYLHLAMLGCVTTSNVHRSFGELISGTYPGIFAGGMTPEGIPPVLRPYSEIFKPCPNSPGMLQVAARDVEDLSDLAERHGLSNDARVTLNGIFTSNALSPASTEAKVIEVYPSAAEFIRRWNESLMVAVNVTSTGVAIGHTNWAKSIAGATELSVWIPADI